jgi:AraC-like DNA-binding protein
MERLKKILDTMEIDLLNIEYCRVGREWNYRNVNNPYSRIYLVTEGSGAVIHHNRQFKLRAGGLYLIPCFTQVTMECPDFLSHYYLHFTARIETGLDILSIFKCHYAIQADRHKISPALFDRLLELNPNRALFEYDARKPIYPRALDLAHQLDQKKTPANLLETNALLRQLLAVFFSDYNSPQTDNTMYGLTRFQTVLDYIRRHLRDPLTIQQLAEIADLNPTYFSNLFSRYMGISPVKYINKRRIEEAQKLLLSTDQTLYQIASAVGFSDEYYFSRVFKKIVGLAPAHYRRQESLFAPR